MIKNFLIILFASFMFSNATGFNGDISNWDISNVLDMNEMFRNTINFNGDLSNWRHLLR